MRKLIFILLSLLAVISLTACSDSSSSSDGSNTPPPQTSPKGVTPLNIAPVASSFSGADNIDIIYRVELEHAGYSYYLVDKNGIITNKLSNNVNDVNNMYNIKVGPEYISDAVSTNSVVISIPSTRFTQVGDAQNEENIPYGTKITAIDSNIEVIAGTTKLADISGTKPSVDLLTYAEMTQGYFSGCSETTNICRSEFTRFPDSSAVVITPKGNTKYENGVISSDTDTINLSVELTARPEERADGYTYLGGSIITQTTATQVVSDNSISYRIERKTPEISIKDMLRVQVINNKAWNAYTTPAITADEWKYDVTILNLSNEGIEISSDNTKNSHVSFSLNIYGNGDSALCLNLLPIKIAGSTENYAVCNGLNIKNIDLVLNEKSTKTILPLTINANGLERALQEQIVYSMTGITEEQIKCIDVQFQMYKASSVNTEHPFYEGKIAANNTKSNYYVMLDPAKSIDRLDFKDGEAPETRIKIKNIVNNNNVIYFVNNYSLEAGITESLIDATTFTDLFRWGEVEDKTTAEEGDLSDRFYLLFVNKDTINTIGTPVAIDNGKVIIDEYRETTLAETEQFLKDNLGSSLAFEPKGAYIKPSTSSIKLADTPATFEIDVDGIQKVTAVNIMSDGYENSEQYNKGLFGSLKEYDAKGTPVFSTGFGFKITNVSKPGNEPEIVIVPHLNGILDPQIIDVYQLISWN